MHSLPTLDWWEVLLRLALAAALGAAIGLERELREREAGLRTHLLVSLGSALFTIVSAYGFHAFLASGQSVVASGVPPAPAMVRSWTVKPAACAPPANAEAPASTAESTARRRRTTGAYPS